jgi:hypothetical protein
MDDARAWRRVIARLEGRDPDLKGSVALARKRMARPGYLTSGHKGSVSLGGRGAISLSRTAGPGYRTRMLGSS